MSNAATASAASWCSQGLSEVYALSPGITASSPSTACLTSLLFADFFSCGASCDLEVPETAEDVNVDEASVSKLHTQAAGISPVFSTEGGATIESTTACYLPIPDRGRPLVGPVPGMEGVFVGGGLSCWGITQGPGVGLVLSEMILEGRAKTADVSKLAP